MTLTHDELRALASRLVTDAGGQSAVAARLGIAQPIISQALSGNRRPYVDVLRRIVEELSGATVDGPVYPVTGLEGAKRVKQKR